jgi:hypothetical protein
MSKNSVRGKRHSDRSQRYLKRARRLISQGSYESAEGILEDLLELEPGHRWAQDLLMEIRREAELLARGASLEGSKYRPDSEPVKVEVDFFEKSAPLKEEEEPEARGTKRKVGDLGAGAVSGEELATDHEEESLSQTEESIQQGYSAEDEEPGSWLEWTWLEEESTTEQVCILLKYFNRWWRNIRVRQTNIGCLDGQWPPWKTEFPRKTLAASQQLDLHRLRVGSGKHNYRVEIIAVEGSTTRILTATLEVSVSDDRPPKLLEVQCR